MQAVLKEEVDHVGIWREMERLVDDGKLKSIGVSNFNSDQIEHLNDAARIPIAVNQVECSPYFQQRKLKASMEKLGIRMMAYASLGSIGDCNLSLSKLILSLTVFISLRSYS
jgi:diketogulonate reductase-like aldo/keto reductase